MVSPKILVTGGAGYIGGSVIAELLAPKTGTPLQPSNIVAIVRKEEQAAKVAEIGVEVANISLTDAPAIEKLVLEGDIDVVVHCASAMDITLASPLIQALGKQKQKTGREVYFVHTSGTSAFADATGWTHGLVRDTDPVYELEKANGQPYFLRDTNIAVYDLAKEHNVAVAIVVPPFIYGEGSGQCGRQTITTPLYIQTGINLKTVNKGRKSGVWPAVNIGDLVEFYVLLIQKILAGNAPTTEVTGHFFPVAHGVNMWDFSDAIAKALHAKGLVDQPKAIPWESDEAAAEGLGMPVAFIPLLYSSITKIEPVRPQQLGWKPKWTEKQFLSTFDTEVEAYFRLSKGGDNMANFQQLIKDKA